MNNYKKIVIVANTSWYLYNYKYTIIEKLVNLGYKVYAVAPYDKYTTRLKELDIQFKLKQYLLQDFCDIEYPENIFSQIN